MTTTAPARAAAGKMMFRVHRSMLFPPFALFREPCRALVGARTTPSAGVVPVPPGLRFCSGMRPDRRRFGDPCQIWQGPESRFRKPSAGPPPPTAGERNVDTVSFGGHPSRVMTRRLTTALLAAAIILAGVIAAPCGGNAACAAFSAQQMDCCKRPVAGFNAARCCSGVELNARGITPATSEGTAQRIVNSAALHIAAIAISTAPPQVVRASGIDPTAAPPDGTLISQHTSLLL